MGAFETPVAWIASICGGIAALAVFFWLLGAVTRWFTRPAPPELAFVAEGARVNVHLRGGQTVSDVTFVGFSPGEPKGSEVPHALRAMLVVVQDPDRRLLIRADRIRMIEELAPPPDRATGSSV